MNSVLAIVFSAIMLEGIVSDDLKTDISFDAYNVQVGDPMMLTIDFVGEADFSHLHPPKLSKEVDSEIWKIDDMSAKTDTYRDARRLVYRVRPVKAGLLEFPSLEFGYQSQSGEEKKIVTEKLPVHVRVGAQAVLLGLEDDISDMPMPDGLIFKVDNLPQKSRFSWNKACAEAKSEGFKDFDFPEARLNEAACLILEGNYNRALSIYSKLEWKIGQTPQIERGIIAALARKNSSSVVSLPVWRMVLRPLLKYAWPARLGFIVGATVLLTAVFTLGFKLIRIIAVIVAIAAPFNVFAFDGFESLFNMTFGGNQIKEEKLEITPSVKFIPDTVTIGENFTLELSVEVPKHYGVNRVEWNHSAIPGLEQVGKVENLTNLDGANPSNTVVRQSIKLRCVAPFSGAVKFVANAYITIKSERNNRGMVSHYSYTRNVTRPAPIVSLTVNDLPDVTKPDGYEGAVGSQFRIIQRADTLFAETNDVIVVTSEIFHNGYLPKNKVSRKFFIASGSEEIPCDTLIFYNPDKKIYEKVLSNSLKIKYRASKEQGGIVAVDSLKSGEDRGIKLLFRPRANSPAVKIVSAEDKSIVVTEEKGAYKRIETDDAAGWVLAEELKK